MTNEHYLEVAKECGAEVWNSYELPIHMTKQTLDSYTARICAEKDAEIVKLHNAHVELERSYLARLSAANAAIAMKDEALKAIDGELGQLASDHYGMNSEEHYNRCYNIVLKHKIRTSPESIAAWEAEKLLPLQRQVAMLHDALVDATGYLPVGMYQTVLSNTQATSEAYERELSVKVLEKYANGWDTDIAQEIRQDAAELRAANKKEGE